LLKEVGRCEEEKERSSRDLRSQEEERKQTRKEVKRATSEVPITCSGKACAE